MKHIFDGIEGSGWSKEGALWLESLPIEDFIDVMNAAATHDSNNLSEEQKIRLTETYKKFKDLNLS